MANNQAGQDSEETHQKRILPENSVEYFIFLLDGRADARRHLTDLETLRKSAIQLSQTLTKDYIWQRDQFSLELKNENGLVYLYGLSDYGDAVEDEWLIVYMLRELTKSHQNLWVRLSDSDGEFLLVEAANVLPKWLNPEIDPNRAWIHDGQLFIVPLSKESEHRSQMLSLREAVDFIKTKTETLVHSPFVEAEAFYRLEKYPGQIEDSLHHSLVTIPRKLAYVLHALPKSIAPAIEVFYLRDPIALKSLTVPTQSMVFPPLDLVTTSVRFSKVLFAQLRSQHFGPPSAWHDVLQTPRGSESPPISESTELTRLETGMKLSCGFEMAAAGAEKNKSRVIRELAIVLEDLQEDGEEVLPSDYEMSQWKDSERDDKESWLDINYEDFERELEGKGKERAGNKEHGFGDANTHADLRKIVSRFEAFLNDDKAGFEGAELDDMDVDDDDEDEDGDMDDDSDSEDKEVSFDEEEFSRMMQEMMGLPANKAYHQSRDTGKVLAEGAASISSSHDEDEEAQIQKLSEQMEAELNRHGALKLDNPVKPPQLHAEEHKSSENEPGASHLEAEDDDSDEQVDIDYNLAKNILESFKSQGGMSGPAGNLLGLMGLQLPRDEDEDEDNNSDEGGVSGPSRKI